MLLKETTKEDIIDKAKEAKEATQAGGKGKGMPKDMGKQGKSKGQGNGKIRPFSKTTVVTTGALSKCFTQHLQ